MALVGHTSAASCRVWASAPAGSSTLALPWKSSWNTFGATPAEAVSWGKVDPRALADMITVYCDATIAAPILTAYVLERRQPRKLRRLYHRRQELYDALRTEFLADYPRTRDNRRGSRPDF